MAATASAVRTPIAAATTTGHHGRTSGKPENRDAMGDMEFTTNIILEGRLVTARVMVEYLMELTAHVVKVARGPSDFMAGGGRTEAAGGSSRERW